MSSLSTSASVCFIWFFFVWLVVFLKVSSYRLYDNLPLASRRAAMQQEIASGGGRVGVELLGCSSEGRRWGRDRRQRAGG